MTTASVTGTDLRVRGAVVRQLDWDPEVDASAIGVSAGDGVVTLTGFVDSYAEKLAAERVAKLIRGVRGVANDIIVRQMVDRTDADIAHDAIVCLKTTARSRRHGAGRSTPRTPHADRTGGVAVAKGGGRACRQAHTRPARHLQPHHRETAVGTARRPAPDRGGTASPCRSRCAADQGHCAGQRRHAQGDGDARGCSGTQRSAPRAVHQALRAWRIRSSSNRSNRTRSSRSTRCAD